MQVTPANQHIRGVEEIHVLTVLEMLNFVHQLCDVFIPCNNFNFSYLGITSMMINIYLVPVKCSSFDDRCASFSQKTDKLLNIVYCLS